MGFNGCSGVGREPLGALGGFPAAFSRSLTLVTGSEEGGEAGGDSGFSGGVSSGLVVRFGMGHH